jgi:ABC-2 type transport system permease protein
MTDRPTTAPVPPSLGRTTLLVAEREIGAQARSKSFIISTVVLLVVVLGGIIAGQLLSSRDSGSGADGSGSSDAVPVAVVDTLGDPLAGAAGFRAVPVADEAAARAQVESGAVRAALVPDPGPAGVRVVVQDKVPDALVAALTVAPGVEVLNPATADEAVRYIVTFGFGIVFMMAAMTFGSTIAQNTVIEKQTRVVEILLSAVPARALLAGKILGNSVLALGQTAAIAAVAVLGLVVTGQDEVLSLVGAPVAWFVVFFAVGFVLLAAMFAAAASLVSRIEDTGPVLQPVMLLVVIPYFIVVFGNDNDTLMRVASYVPFTAPVAMPARLYLGDAAWWEPLIALVLLAATAAVVVALAAVVYQRSVLRMGARVRLTEVLGRRAVSA